MATKELKKEITTTEVNNTKISEEKKQVVKPILKDAETNAKALQKEIDKKAKELEKCLKDLETKKKLANNRTKFIDVLDRLTEIKSELQPSDSFETENFTLIFSSKQNYSNRAEFSISNTVIILDFIDYIKEKINKKIEELEAELIK